MCIEQHEQYGQETSSRNSEVIHSGIYYPPDALKTRLCIAGRHELYRVCERYGIPHRRTGKLVVAQTAEQMEYLEHLKAKADALHVPLEWRSPEHVAQVEPSVQVRCGALEAPETGIVDAHALMTWLLGEFEDAGGDFAAGTRLTSLESRHDGFRIGTDDGGDVHVTADIVVNAAGLYACQVSNLLLPSRDHVQPYYAKGTYYAMGSSRLRVSRLVYPCPEPGLAGLGTHLTLDLAGRLRFGPDVSWIKDPTDYSVDSTAEASIDAATEAIQAYLPSVRRDELVADYTGIRPKLGPAGSGFHDFVIRHEATAGYPGFVNLLGIESPGLTSSLAIGDMVADMLA